MRYIRLQRIVVAVSVVGQYVSSQQIRVLEEAKRTVQTVLLVERGQLSHLTGLNVADHRRIRQQSGARQLIEKGKRRPARNRWVVAGRRHPPPPRGRRPG